MIRTGVGVVIHSNAGSECIEVAIGIGRDELIFAPTVSAVVRVAEVNALVTNV